jgi:hypothetical protein
MHKPLRASFTEVINAVADGKGFKLSAKDQKRQQQNVVQASQPKPTKKP